MPKGRTGLGDGLVGIEAMIEAAEAARLRGETVRLTIDFIPDHSVAVMPERLEQDTGQYRVLGMLRAPTLADVEAMAAEDMRERGDHWSGVKPKPPIHRPGRA